MNIDKALKILKLNNYNKNNIYELSLNQLKKAYHIQALLFHPDKNKNLDAATNFRKIQESYELLYKILNDEDDFKDNFNNNINDNINDNIEKYSELILNFINLISNNINNLNNNPEKLREMEKDIKKFKSNCIEYSYSLIENFLNNLNIEIIEEIYLFLCILSKNENNKLKIINNISQSTIDMLLNILKKKLEDFNIYIITPNLKNILNNEIYKLTIKDEIVYIPLWHKELNYENNIIKIQPNLRENEKIDNNNNLIIKYTTNYEIIAEKMRTQEFPNLEIKLEDLDLDLDLDLDFMYLKIPLHELKIIKNQYYFFKNNGISLINNKEIMDISKKGNIIVDLTII